MIKVICNIYCEFKGIVFPSAMYYWPSLRSKWLGIPNNQWIKRDLSFFIDRFQNCYYTIYFEYFQNPLHISIKVLFSQNIGVQYFIQHSETNATFLHIHGNKKGNQKGNKKQSDFGTNWLKRFLIYYTLKNWMETKHFNIRFTYRIWIFIFIAIFICNMH